MIYISKANTRKKVSRGPFTSRFLPLGRTFKDSGDHGFAQIGRMEHATFEAGAPMTFRSDVLFYDIRLEHGESVQTPDLKGRTGFLYISDGGVTIQNRDEIICEGDSVIIRKERLFLKSNEETDMVFFILNEKAQFSRNGLYTK